MLPKSRRLPIADFFSSRAPRPVRILRNQIFSIKIYTPALKYSRFGVVVSKKMADKASARVKIKRIIFNFLRLHSKSLPVFDYLILPSPSIIKLDSTAIEKSLSELLLSLTLDSRF